MTIERDLYTKALLTVIAGCLLFQCAMLVGTRLDAQAPAARPDAARQMPAQPVVIVGWGEMSASGQLHLTPLPPAPIPVAIAAPQPVPVAVNPPQQPVPVAITGIHNAFGQWDTINTRLEPQPASPLPGYPSPPKH
jgi:hypothetical protein